MDTSKLCGMNEWMIIYNARKKMRITKDAFDRVWHANIWVQFKLLELTASAESQCSHFWFCTPTSHAFSATATKCTFTYSSYDCMKGKTTANEHQEDILVMTQGMTSLSVTFNCTLDMIMWCTALFTMDCSPLKNWYHPLDWFLKGLCTPQYGL